MEEAPLAPCVKLVFRTRKEMRDKERHAERARQEAEFAERRMSLIEQKKTEEQEEEERQRLRKLRRVTYQESSADGKPQP